jgi:ornithine carbamoyltransferase
MSINKILKDKTKKNIKIKKQPKKMTESSQVIMSNLWPRLLEKNNSVKKIKNIFESQFLVNPLLKNEIKKKIKNWWKKSS